MELDYNYLINISLAVSGFLILISGVWMVVSSFLNFRAQINQSMNLDLDVIRVSKINKTEEEKSKDGETWKGEIGAMEQMLTAFSSVRDTRGLFKRLIYGSPCISLEIANSAKSEEIIFFIAIPKRFRENIEKQIHSFFPYASLEKTTDFNIFCPGGKTEASIIKLKNKFFLPIKTYEKQEIDPLNAIANALSKLDVKNEGAAVQLVIRPAGTAWRGEGKSIAHKMQQGKQLHDVNKSVFGHILDVLKDVLNHFLSFGKKDDASGMDNKNKTVQLTPEEQDLIKSIENKALKTGFETNIRLVASAETLERAQEMLSHLENAFAQYENGDVNSFKIKRADKKTIVFDFIFRNFKAEEKNILSVEELASIFHIPISTTEAPKIKWLKSNASAPPIDIPAEGIILGYNQYRGTKTTIRIGEKDRRRHLYTIGQTGVGKSNFLQEMAKQDAREGRGFCFIDPHGDAIEDILTAIPKERAQDVIVFDPSDVERPFGLNMLEYDPAHPEQMTFVINEMIGIFDQLYDLKATGGPIFEQYMRNAMFLVMSDPESGSTLLEISKVLSDEEFRTKKLSKCSNQTVVDFWTKEAEKAGGEAALANMVPYITSKLTPFISNDMMRPIISQQKSTINFRDIMDNKKILLVALSKGKIGEINARLLGMVIVGKILMAALGRTSIPEDQRVDFYLYLDEFQNVTTNSISQILSEARKYHLCLIIAHQFIAQLKEDISKAVFGNVGSMVAFRVGPEDAEFLEKQFAPTFRAQDIVNVDNYNGFARILVNNILTKPFNLATFPPTAGNQEMANAIKELSRLNYGRDKHIVNQEIIARTRF
jgi:hypothetical protein